MMFSRLLSRSLSTTQLRPSSAYSVRRFATGGLENILAGDLAPPVQVKSLGPNGIQLADGLEIPSACIFLEGKVFLWNVPQTLWKGWDKEHFQVFETVVPKPGRHRALICEMQLNNLPSRSTLVWDWEECCAAATQSSQSSKSHWSSSGCDGHSALFVG
jgi:hypothetical protein